MRNINKVIEQRNAQWEKASRQERRIMIAKDVLSVLNTPKVKIEQGVYCRFAREDFETFQGSDEGQIQEMLIEGQLSCTACAKGSMLLARLGYKDTPNLEDIQCVRRYDSVSNNETLFALDDLYTHEEMNRIEALFEATGMNGFEGYEVNDMLSNFSSSPKRRLRQMMERIIACDGDVEKALTTDPKELVCNPKQKLKELLKEKS